MPNACIQFQKWFRDAVTCDKSADYLTKEKAKYFKVRSKTTANVKTDCLIYLKQQLIHTHLISQV